ncbi:MAG: alpha-1,2-fucosyltransferase [Chlamydiota bacterium]|nr:alpha-1,2-fucosyltransferase [Chlamydiota bacterium]
MFKKSSLFAFFLFCLIQHLHTTPFVTSFLNGQLGNQMHQVATAVCLAIDHNAEATFPEFRTRTDVGIPVNYEKVFWRLNTHPLPSKINFVWKEPKHTYTPIQYHANMQLRGHFQSYKYIEKHREFIQSLFAPSEEILETLNSTYKEILEHPCSVAIHVRTYNAEDPKHSNFAKCGYNYFKKAVAKFPKDALFILCSDDIAWCKKTFSGLASNIIYIENNPHYLDFYLISQCKHQIITNSTFSWWAAYLNLNPNKIVVAPRRWFVPRREYDNKEIVPKEWIVIDNLHS